jgi:hypothetical protein
VLGGLWGCCEEGVWEGGGEVVGVAERDAVPCGVLSEQDVAEHVCFWTE